MKKHIILSSSLVLALLSVLVLATAAKASSNAQEDVVSHGEYIANIAGCIDCHTPFQKEYQDPAQMTLDQLKLLAFNLGATQDRDNKLLAGGRPFDLGPAGVLLTRNLTPDEDTGLGGWTDEQIRITVRTGINSEGRLLFPVMPYHVYNSMADSDLDALIAYLRTIKPVENNTPKSTIPTDGFPSPTYQTGIVAPDASDKAARGSYLINSIMGCTDCHTPVDPVTGAPQMDKYLAGRQPYEGPWGIVYGGNITPDNETGIGTWSEEEIVRAITSGVSKDGRRLILMPWFNYATLKAEDAEAVAYYLKNVLPAVNNEIPAPSLKEGFEEMAPAEPGQAATVKAAMLPVVLVLAAVGVILLVSLLAYFFRRRTA